jgi:hypothetical protein
MGQQHFIIKRMPPLVIGKAGAPAATPSSGGLTSLLKGKQPEPVEPTPTRLTQKRQSPAPTAATEGSDGSAPETATGATAAGTGTNGSRSVKPAQSSSRPNGRPAPRKRAGSKGNPRRGGRR